MGCGDCHVHKYAAYLKWYELSIFLKVSPMNVCLICCVYDQTRMFYSFFRVCMSSKYSLLRRNGQLAYAHWGDVSDNGSPNADILGENSSSTDDVGVIFFIFLLLQNWSSAIVSFFFGFLIKCFAPFLYFFIGYYHSKEEETFRWCIVWVFQ